MPSKTVFIELAIIIAAVKCAVIKHDDNLYRSARSASPPLSPSSSTDDSSTPSPPPPHFHTQQWSGLTRSKDGLQQGVFSGAAAAIGAGPQSSGESFSLAATSAKSGLSNRFGGDCDNGQEEYQNNGAQNFGANAASDTKTHPYKGYYSDDKQQHLPNGASGGYGAHSGAQSAASSNSYSSSGYDNFSNEEGHGNQDSSSFTNGFRHDQGNKYQSINLNDPQGQGRNRVGGQFSGRPGYKEFESGTPAHKEAYQNNLRPSQNLYGYNDYQQRGPAGYGASSGAHSQSYSGSNSHTNDKQNVDDNYSQRGDQGTQQQQQQTNNNGFSQGKQQEYPGNYKGNKQQQVNLSEQRQQFPENSQANNGLAGAPASGDDGNIRETLGGALNLASQGLQASQQASCSTCGKNSYALSNAKSYSGSAIALSIGG